MTPKRLLRFHNPNEKPCPSVNARRILQRLFPGSIGCSLFSTLGLLRAQPPASVPLSLHLAEVGARGSIAVYSSHFQNGKLLRKICLDGEICHASKWDSPMSSNPGCFSRPLFAASPCVYTELWYSNVGDTSTLASGKAIFFRRTLKRKRYTIMWKCECWILPRTWSEKCWSTQQHHIFCFSRVF